MLMRHHERKVKRRPTRRAAEVLFGPDEPRIRCVIWDISEGGARLAVAYPITNLPPRFTLLLEGKIQRQCEIVWTDARYAGVKFV
jgi:hypothetical protein